MRLCLSFLDTPKSTQTLKTIISNFKMSKNKKESGFGIIFLVMLASMLIALFWDKMPFIKNSVNAILIPSAGALITWNLNLGMLIIVFILTLVITLIQKYATDQETLKELKKEQKEIQKEMKKFKHHPEKVIELQRKNFESVPKMMKLSMRGIIFTAVPLILFFRWFSDFFNTLGNPKFLGFDWMSWFWFYIIFSMIFSSILRKILDVV